MMPRPADLSRQYASIIFTHNDAQREAAERCLSKPAQNRAATTVEPATPFWDAEAYHQKWLLQRKRPLMMSLGMTDASELWSKPATGERVAAGKPAEVALNRLDGLVAAGELEEERFASVAAELVGLYSKRVG